MNFLEPAGPQMFQNFWRSKMSAGKQILAKLKWLITTALIVFFTPLVWVCSAGWKRSNPTMGWAGGDLKDHFTPTYPRCSNLVWGRKYSDCVHVCCYLALSGKSYFKLQIFFLFVSNCKIFNFSTFWIYKDFQFLSKLFFAVLAGLWESRGGAAGETPSGSRGVFNTGEWRHSHTAQPLGWHLAMAVPAHLWAPAMARVQNCCVVLLWALVQAHVLGLVVPQLGGRNRQS